ncbi:probable histone-lysine N-methyltransferase set-23 [Drosophila sulfurigaster albostrigata]|uniref:probable histone-lysine N-methyltransferase set-23 n=1 Tax=Drosophila sulfurigaster albostrigata TaxID=89887 RepID=UPI002D21E71D|nr:probable histone-lysine N-methyltransferase set-23 [Drosophila sulfurigaster albostrigata]
MIEICDDYDHKDLVEYILENVLMPDDGSEEFKRLKDDYNSQITSTCTCVIKNCNNNIDCCHGGYFKYHLVNKELVLVNNEDTSLHSVTECNDFCKCDLQHCNNRLVQFGPRKKLEIFLSPQYKSMGVRTLIDIPCGAFICEYAGELLTLAEAKRRLDFVDNCDKMNFIFCLREFTKSKDNTDYQASQVTIVDPTFRGNIGRYLNHSCQPNCEIFAVRINCPIPKIGIFAKRNIYANEELCFHYGGENLSPDLTNGKPCLCSAPNCVGVLPNTRI